MTAIQVLCVAASVILFQVSSGAQVGDPLEGKSAISTEYKARFHKIHPNGVNTSEGYIAGVHNMEKNTDEESWPSFASKCAEVIKGIVAALTGAVTSEPGERTDLLLDFKNRIYHHDNRKVNDTAAVSAPESEEYEDPEEMHDEDTAEYTNIGSPADADFQYPNTHYGRQRPMESYPTERPESLGHRMEYVGVTQASPEPTWNTPATQEIVYRPTEEINHYQHDRAGTETPSSEEEEDATGHPPYQGFKDSGESSESEEPYQMENLPLDHWKPTHDGQQDFLPETPVGFGDGPPSSRLFTVPPETYTSSGPIGATEVPEPLDSPVVLQQGRRLPEPANRVAENNSEDNESKEVEDEQSEERSSEEDEHSTEHPVPPQEQNFISEEKSPSVLPDMFVPDATQIVPTLSEEGWYSPHGPDEEMADLEDRLRRPPYGKIYTVLASTTPSPQNAAIYIPITNAQTESMPEGGADLDDDCCCEEDTYDDESPKQKVICKNACRDLEQARNELKAIFDKIKKKLRCSRRLTNNC